MDNDVMKDVVYAALAADPAVQRLAENRIKFYEYPETGDVSGPVIVIDPLDAPLPEDYADDTWMTWDHLYQIEVWSRSRVETSQLADRVTNVLWTAGLRPTGGGADEWDRETGIFRQARRYRGRFYREDIK